jgi:multiple sugar transport system substrate-binding protein
VKTYVGLTWDHPRGYVALERAAAAAQGIALRWERQPLEGFESHPIEELAERYDLIVLDHPHVGDAVAADCLQPLESLFGADDLARWQAQSIGRTFDSYHYGGRHWALPLDAATQVAVARADLLDGPPPASWQEVVTLARAQPICMSLAGPHAALTLFSIAAAHGDAPAAHDPERLFDGPGAAQAWDLLRELQALAAPRWAALNPIGMLDAMARSADGEAAPAYCPLIYGYVNYAVAGGGRQALRFVDAPSGPQHTIGSTLGGTGLAVSRRVTVDGALRGHLLDLMSLSMQTAFIPFADGQPSARVAWHDDKVNAAWNGFYAGTARTLEAAIVRPRFAGYIAFQTAASAAIREALAARHGAARMLDTLQTLYAQHRPANGAP